MKRHIAFCLALALISVPAAQARAGEYKEKGLDILTPEVLLEMENAGRAASEAVLPDLFPAALAASGSGSGTLSQADAAFAYAVPASPLPASTAASGTGSVTGSPADSAPETESETSPAAGSSAEPADVGPVSGTAVPGASARTPDPATGAQTGVPEAGAQTADSEAAETEADTQMADSETEASSESASSVDTTEGTTEKAADSEAEEGPSDTTAEVDALSDQTSSQENASAGVNDLLLALTQKELQHLGSLIGEEAQSILESEQADHIPDPIADGTWPVGMGSGLGRIYGEKTGSRTQDAAAPGEEDPEANASTETDGDDSTPSVSETDGDDSSPSVSEADGEDSEASDLPESEVSMTDRTAESGAGDGSTGSESGETGYTESEVRQERIESGVLLSGAEALRQALAGLAPESGSASEKATASDTETMPEEELPSSGSEEGSRKPETLPESEDASETDAEKSSDEAGPAMEEDDSETVTEKGTESTDAAERAMTGDASKTVTEKGTDSTDAAERAMAEDASKTVTEKGTDSSDAAERAMTEDGSETEAEESTEEAFRPRHKLLGIPEIEDYNAARLNLYDYRMLRTYPLLTLPRDLHGLYRALSDQVAGFQGTWSVYVENLSTRQALIVGDQSMKSASVMKLFIMAAVYDAIDRGELTRSEELVYLLRDMIINSSNSAANDLLLKLGDGSYADGIALVNDYIRSHGYSPMTCEYNGFEDASAIVNGDSFNQIAAKDVGLLLERIYSRNFISRNVCNEIESMMLEQNTRYKIPSGIPDGVPVGNKTGEMDTVENDAAIVYGSDTDYILVILSEDWDSQEDADSHITDLSKYVYEYLEG